MQMAVPLMQPLVELGWLSIHYDLLVQLQVCTLHTTYHARMCILQDCRCTDALKKASWDIVPTV